MKKIFFIFILLSSCPILAQTNLVPNPSFEDKYNCATQLSDVKNWYSANQGSPDYLCNNFTDQYPKSGIAFVGIATFTTLYPNEREYIQVKLNEKLEADSSYIITFYTVSSNLVKFCTNNIGAYVSIQPVSEINYNIIELIPQLKSTAICDTVNWIRIEGVFKAQGGEEYLTIGNFYRDTDTYFSVYNQNASNGYSSGYYFIDDVSLRKCDTCKDTIKVTIQNNLFIPDAFSPNGDGNNDNLFVRGNNIQELYFAVYDRWGEKVFETTDKNNGWDGTYKGSTVSGAVFVYYCKGKYTDGKEFKQKGDVTLVR